MICHQKKHVYQILTTFLVTIFKYIFLLGREGGRADGRTGGQAGGRTSGRTDERAEGRASERTDARTSTSNEPPIAFFVSA